MNATKLSEYILLPRSERTAHIDLSTPCECNKRKGKQENSGLFKKLCGKHGIINDIAHRRMANIDVCHLCPQKHCQNPSHAYIGTSSENYRDVPEEKRMESAKTQVVTRRMKQMDGMGISGESVGELVGMSRLEWLSAIVMCQKGKTPY